VPEKRTHDPACGSAAVAARDQRTVVPLRRSLARQCPRDETRREERGLLRISGTRLGPRRDDIEE